MPADLAPGLEVDQVQRLAKLDVVFDWKIERAGSADLAQLAAVVLGESDGCIGMCQVGNAAKPLANLVIHHAELFFLVG